MDELSMRIAALPLGLKLVCADPSVSRQFPHQGRAFPLGTAVIPALGILKKCAALANGELRQL